MLIPTRCIHDFMSNLIKISRTDSSTYLLGVPDYIRGGCTGNNSVTPNYPLSHLTPSFDDFAVEIAAKGNKSSPIHFLF